jgi:hypothetical protein
MEETSKERKSVFDPAAVCEVSNFDLEEFLARFGVDPKMYQSQSLGLYLLLQLGLLNYRAVVTTRSRKGNGYSLRFFVEFPENIGLRGCKGEGGSGNSMELTNLAEIDFYTSRITGATFLGSAYPIAESRFPIPVSGAVADESMRRLVIGMPSEAVKPPAGIPVIERRKAGMLSVAVKPPAGIPVIERRKTGMLSGAVKPSAWTPVIERRKDGVPSEAVKPPAGIPVIERRKDGRPLVIELKKHKEEEELE